MSRLEEEYEGRVNFKIYDVAGLDDATRNKYKFVAFPQFVIVGRDGTTAFTRLGYQTYDSLKSDLEYVLSR